MALHGHQPRRNTFVRIQNKNSMTAHQITHIRKPYPHSTHEHVTHVKYDGVVHTREEVIRLIQNRTDTFFVHAGGATIQVEVVHPGLASTHSTYIRTKPDWTGKDNLLSLPPC